MALFESYERRIDQINAELAKHGISSIEEAKQICDDKGIDVYNMVKGIQLLPMTVRLVSATAISVQDFYAKRQSALHFSQVTNHLRRRKVQSVLQRAQTKQEKRICV